MDEFINAAICGAVSTLELLLRDGVEIDGYTALMLAAYYAKSDAAAFLLKSGASFEYAKTELTAIREGLGVPTQLTFNNAVLSAMGSRRVPLVLSAKQKKQKNKLNSALRLLDKVGRERDHENKLGQRFAAGAKITHAEMAKAIGCRPDSLFELKPVAPGDDEESMALTS
jgi:hypothetical protein